MPRNECTWVVLTDCFVFRHNGTFLEHPDEATIVLESPVMGIAGIKLIVTLVLNNKTFICLKLRTSVCIITAY